MPSHIFKNCSTAAFALALPLLAMWQYVAKHNCAFNRSHNCGAWVSACNECNGSAVDCVCAAVFMWYINDTRLRCKALAFPALMETSALVGLS